jgi:hypothetical protein
MPSESRAEEELQQLFAEVRERNERVVSIHVGVETLRQLRRSRTFGRELCRGSSTGPWTLLGIPIALIPDLDALMVRTELDEEFQDELRGTWATVLRNTGRAPALIELGENHWVRFRRLFGGAFYNGVAVQCARREAPGYLMMHSQVRPPSWCIPGVVLSHRESSNRWVKVQHLEALGVRVDLLEGVPNALLPYAEIDDWVPAKTSPLSRFARLRKKLFS